MKQAIIDIGTNSSLLLIGSVSDKNKIQCDRQKFIVTRLGEGISKSDMIKEEAMQRTLDALEEFNQIIRELHIQSVHVLGTEALRKAKNSNIFKDMVRAKFDWDLQIIKPTDEATYSYLGALDSIHKPDGQNLVIDVGGGSTELILGEKMIIRSSCSIPVGVVRLAERYSMKQQLSADDRTQIESVLHDNFGSQKIFNDLKRNITIIGVGGTITTLVAIQQKMFRYDPGKVNGYVIDVSKINNLFTYLNSLSLEERRRIPGLVKGREDVILYGTLIFLYLLRQTKQNCIVASDRGLRFGYLKWLSLKTETDYPRI